MIGNVLGNMENSPLRLLRCGYTRISPNQWNYSGVSMPFWRLYWNSGPGASIRFNNLTFHLTPATAVLIAPNTLFSTLNTKVCEHLYIHFQILGSAIHPAQPSALDLPVKRLLNGIRRALCEELQEQVPSPLKVSLVARSLVGMALSLSDLNLDNAFKIDPRIQKVLFYMEEHLKFPTSNTTLAKEVQMSEGALNRLFKKQTGRPLQGILRLKRIEKAAMLLQGTHLSIEQIAEEAGFCDRYHFSRIFRLMQGTSPAAYRQLHLNPFVPPTVEAR